MFDTAGRGGRTALGLALPLIVACFVACQAVYPEFTTATRKPATGVVLDPPAPADVFWLKFKSARLPEKTKDGRGWGASGPSTYAKLLVNGVEVLRSSVQQDSLEPTWANGPRGNFVLGPEDRLRLELWESGAVSDRIIGGRDIGRLSEDQRMNHEVHLDFDVGTDLSLTIEPAHAMLGLGLSYELQSERCVITKVLAQSDAGRAGLLRGDEVVRIGDATTQSLGADGIRSHFNAVPASGLSVTVLHADGKSATVILKEGPLYPLRSEFGNLD
jgi:hypothetical protein